jgi:chaperonin GroES
MDENGHFERSGLAYALDSAYYLAVVGFIADRSHYYLLTVKYSYMAKDAQKLMNIQPIADRVLVQRIDKPETKTVGGIIIPDTAQKEKSKLGKVIATGPGRTTDDGKLVAMSIKKGATVVFNAGWDNEVDLGDDEAYFLIKESDILAVVNK